MPKMITVDIAIRVRAKIHDHPASPNQPNLTFMPKKLAMRVGGMSIRDTRVNTFMILFWSRLMIPRTVF